MDSGQIPPVQSTPPTQVVTNGMPMVQQAQAAVAPEKSTSDLVKTIVIVVASLVAVTFIGLFIWMLMQYNEVQVDVEGQIAEAVAEAKNDQALKDEAEFAEREKDPYKTFAGPSDYGHLTFEYPKTWSVYVANDASNGGDFAAYFNPNQVDAVSKDTINALRVMIRNESFEDVVASYQKIMDKKDSDLAMESITVGNEEKGISVTANRYVGTIPNTSLSGIIIVFKIRDKTAVLQTDSMSFEGDFEKLLSTIVFNA